MGLKMQAAKPQSARPFGADDRPPCPKCGHDMHVSRRTPHPVPALQHLYELQILTCTSCGEERERSANREGQPLAEG